MPAELHPAELAASYAALILHDSSLPVKAESITAICKAANVAVPPFWPKLFQDVFATRSVGDFLLSNVSAGAAPAAAAPAGGAPAAKGAAEKKEEKKVEEKPKEESDEDMGFGLFD